MTPEVAATIAKKGNTVVEFLTRDAPPLAEIIAVLSYVAGLVTFTAETTFDKPAEETLEHLEQGAKAMLSDLRRDKAK